jgi:hypothetical protein
MSVSTGASATNALLSIVCTPLPAASIHTYRVPDVPEPACPAWLLEPDCILITQRMKLACYSLFSMCMHPGLCQGQDVTTNSIDQRQIKLRAACCLRNPSIRVAVACGEGNGANRQDHGTLTERGFTYF